MSAGKGTGHEDAGAGGAHRHGFLDHLQVAAVVASLVTLLHVSGLLGWLDASMLRLLGSATPGSAQTGLDGDADMNAPVVLTIGAALHETTFAQASPLDRGPLARLVDTVAAQRPKVLVIDLDLSPGPPPAAAQAALDDALRRAAAAGIRVVLPLPFRVSTRELEAVKFAWMQQMCALDGLDFALPDIVTHLGTVLMFDTRAPSLGVVSAREPAPRSQALCALARLDQGDAPGLLLGIRFGDSLLRTLDFGSALNLRNFNARFFETATQRVHRLDAVDALPVDAAGRPLALTGRVVFLGSGYNPADRFVLPLSSTRLAADGVVVHAAVHDSVWAPVTRVQGLLAFGLDLLLGVGMAYLFSYSWTAHQRQKRLWLQQGRLASYLRMRGWLLGNVLLLAAVVWLCLTVARSLFFPWSLWVNPGPIILGVFVKFMLTSRHAIEADAPAEHAVHPPSPVALRIEQGGTLVLLGAALATLLLLPH